MATNAQIFETRLSLKDPIGFIAIIEVADAESLPATPAAQTLYFVAATGEYQAFEDGAWVRQDLEMSDIRMGTFIDLYGVTKAKWHIVKEYVRSLGQKLALVQHSNGSENFVYQNLAAVYAFYKGLLDELNDEVVEEAGASTGRYFRTKKPMVGGMLS